MATCAQQQESGEWVKKMHACSQRRAQVGAAEAMQCDARVDEEVMVSNCKSRNGSAGGPPAVLH